jgi:hypothetical protein
VTTTNLRPPRREWYDLPVPVAIVICVFALLAIAGLIGKIHSAPVVAAVPTPALAIVIATPQPTTAPTPAAQVAAVPVGNVTTRAIVVYGDHDLATAIGAVEAGRAFVPLSRYGSEWTQVDMAGGTGVVYARTADLYGIPELVDLEPPPAPQVIYQVVSAPAPAAPTPEPEQYMIVSEPPAIPTAAPVVRAEDFKPVDPKAGCGVFIGCLGR